MQFLVLVHHPGHPLVYARDVAFAPEPVSKAGMVWISRRGTRTSRRCAAGAAGRDQRECCGDRRQRRAAEGMPTSPPCALAVIAHDALLSHRRDICRCVDEATI